MNRSTTIRSPVDRGGFASKALLLGLFVGAGLAIRTSDVVWVQAAVTGTATVLIAGAVYLLLCRLAAWVSEQAGHDGRPETGSDRRQINPANRRPAADGGQDSD